MEMTDQSTPRSRMMRRAIVATVIVLSFFVTKVSKSAATALTLITPSLDVRAFREDLNSLAIISWVVFILLDTLFLAYRSYSSRRKVA